MISPRGDHHRLRLDPPVFRAREHHAQKKTLTAAELDRPDVQARRAAWLDQRRAFDPRRLVFIDETWAKTNIMAPLRGWAPCGQRLEAKVPHAHWKTCTFSLPLRHDRVEAPWLLDGPVNGECFRLYVERVLVPSLKPGDLVVMDNLGSHRGKAVRRAIRSAGARLFLLPKYYPTSTRSNSCSPSSSTGSTAPPHAPPTPSAMLSARSWIASPLNTAETTSPKPDMTRGKIIPLNCLSSNFCRGSMLTDYWRIVTVSNQIPCFLSAHAAVYNTFNIQRDVRCIVSVGMLTEGWD